VALCSLVVLIRLRRAGCWVLRPLDGGDLDADAANAVMSDVRQTMHAVGRVEARGFGARVS
jgi:hypothetical protein